MPPDLAGSPAEDMWQQMGHKENDSLTSSILTGVTTKENIDEAFKKNCVLYFPFNRYEEPAWLNEENLTYRARHMDAKRLVGYTSRKVIASSPLHDNQDWLFDVLFDQVAFEVSTTMLNLPIAGGQRPSAFPVFQGYSGNATRTYNTALEIVREFTRKSDARFGIGRRNDRLVSIHSGAERLVPNIFQLSSGETSLLNLFLSILRDFDLSGTTFSDASDIRGIVVVDEIDLHLHAVHQYEVLPRLMKMFPKVQFVVTTHSPLLVLGMKRSFGENGFALYRMPQGQVIDPEEFGEFGDAYQAFTLTSKFSADIRIAVKNAQSPILYVEGKTDVQYLNRAAELLDRKAMLAGVRIDDGGGKPGLKATWSAISKLSDDLVPRKVVLLYDCDYEGPPETLGNRFKCKIPKQSDHPIERGIENLFTEATLKRVMNDKPQYVDITPAYIKTERGEQKPVPEKWTINDNEKTNLCNWFCESGTQKDFQHFQVIFDLIEEVLD